MKFYDTMWRNVWRLVFVVAIVIAGVTAYAQPKTNSPFSRFGLGDVNSPNFVPVSSMGGIGAVYHNPYITNIVNPASLGFLKATSFEVAVAGKWGRLEKNDFQEDIYSGNLQYLSLSIPVINPINQILERKEVDLSGSINISISPVSQVGYLIISGGDVDSVGTVGSIFRGQGGTNRLNLGTGWKYRGFAVGINLGYLFGALEYQTLTDLTDDVDNAYNHLARNNYTIRGFLYDLGGMYQYQLRKSKRQNLRNVTLGVHFNSATSFTGKDDYLNMVQSPVTGHSDTAEYRLGEPVDGRLPGKFGIGVMIEENNRYKAGLTFTKSSWSKYENSARPEQLKDTWRLAAGWAYTPDAVSITSYLKRVEYRAGGFYGTDFRTLDGEQASEYGVSIGMGFPFIQQRLFSYLNVSIEYGWRGVAESLKENYLRLKLGVNLNDTQWFIKRRYQ